MKPIDKLLLRLVLSVFVGVSPFLATANGIAFFCPGCFAAKLNVENAPLARVTRPELSFASVIKKVAPSVVNIYTAKIPGFLSCLKIRFSGNSLVTPMVTIESRESAASKASVPVS